MASGVSAPQPWASPDGMEALYLSRIDVLLKVLKGGDDSAAKLWMRVRLLMHEWYWSDVVGISINRISRSESSRDGHGCSRECRGDAGAVWYAAGRGVSSQLACSSHGPLVNGGGHETSLPPCERSLPFFPQWSPQARHPSGACASSMGQVGGRAWMPDHGIQLIPTASFHNEIVPSRTRPVSGDLLDGGSYDHHGGDLVAVDGYFVHRRRWLESLACSMQEQAVKQRTQRVQELLRAALRPFKTFDVVASWLAANYQTVASRRKFLVITGPSGVGKTEFVRSLFPENSILELNGGCLEHINLEAFDMQRHHCILWEDLPAAAVVCNRRVFQHPSSWIDMGRCPPGQRSMRYWLNDAVSVIATNRWGEDLQALSSHSDACWLEANSVVLQVESCMWVAA